MTQGLARTACIVGVEGHLVEVRAGIEAGAPAFSLTGLPATTLNECRNRVRAGLANSGHRLPQAQISVTVASHGQPVLGTGTDLAIAVALLCASRVVPFSSGRCVHVGELGLDGRIRPVRGVLPAVRAAVEAGRPRVVVAEENVREAELCPGAVVHGARTLRDVIAMHDRAPVVPSSQDDPPDADQPLERGPGWPGQDHVAGAGAVVPDFGDVIASPDSRRAVEVAAAGGHHLLLIGSGSSASRLASALPGLLPDLSLRQALEVTAIASVAGVLDPDGPLIRRPPLVRPHHAATTLVSLVGGGSGLPRPGAFCRAHRGVLVLDQAPEFAPAVLDALRPPLDQNQLLIRRGGTVIGYPAQFQLVLTAGRHTTSRLPGWLRDRVDLQAQLPPAPATAPRSAPGGENTASVAARVAQAHAAQRERLTGTRWARNSEVPGSWLRGKGRLPSKVIQDVDLALERGQLSIRGYDQVLRLGWTLADLAGKERPGEDGLAEALRLHLGRGIR